MSDPSPDPSAEPRTVGEEVRHTLARSTPWAVSFLFHAVIVAVAIGVIITVLPEEDEPSPSVVTAGFAHRPQPVMQPQVLEPTETRARRTIAPAPTPPTPTTTVGTTTIGGDGDVGFDPPGDTDNVDFDPELPPNDEFKPPLDPPAAAKRVVFVIDASGSLLDTLPFVIEELKATLRRRAADAETGAETGARFEVVFFRDGKAVAVPAPHRGWKPWTRDAVRATERWLDEAGVDPGGKTDPLPALTYALGLRHPAPDAVVLLSDNITGLGVAELEQRRLVNDIVALNTAGLPISTVQFLHEDPLARYGERATLALIAEETGGEHRFFSYDDLMSARIR